jgi:hypothetical protein
LEFDIALLSSRGKQTCPLKRKKSHESHEKRSLNYTALVRANRGSYGSIQKSHEGRELDDKGKRQVENLKIFCFLYL